MTKSKASTTKTIGVILILGILTIVLFQYALIKKEPDSGTVSVENTELETLLDKDFELYYPATPRDVVKMYSRMLKCMYSGISSDDAVLLGEKMRELYAEEFLEANPEDKYNSMLSADVVLKQETNTTMLQYEVEKSSLVQYSTSGDRKIATMKAVYTMKKGGRLDKSAEKIYLVLENDRWKIYGWKLSENTEIETD